jgi:hypothetical protein
MQISGLPVPEVPNDRIVSFGVTRISALSQFVA